jgi:hypothetical protein
MNSKERDERIVPGVVKAARAALGYCVTYSAMTVAIRAADEARGLREERQHTGRHDGLMVRLVSDWRPVEEAT